MPTEFAITKHAQQNNVPPDASSRFARIDYFCDVKKEWIKCISIARRITLLTRCMDAEIGVTTYLTMEVSDHALIGECGC